MSVYVVAQIQIHDRERYSQYEAGFVEIFRRYEGEAVGVDDEAEVIEGSTSFSRCVILRFPSGEAFRAWYDSEEYQEIAAHRWAASTAHVSLVRGLD